MTSKQYRMLVRPESDRVKVWEQVKAHYAEDPIVGSEKIDSIDETAYAAAARLYSTEIHITCEDSLDAAIRLCQKGLEPLLLNMADWDVAGGCVESGARTQEEELFRRGNYHKFLLQEYYPLGDITSYLSRGVEFHGWGLQKDYILLDQVVYIDCIASPAIINPKHDWETGLFRKQDDINLMRFKIRQLFWAAQRNGNDSLVLSAWGCGAFGCPAEQIAELFREICEERSGVFKVVVFAILGGGLNHEKFKRVFKP
jgi:uncharacterized protein (TIGR02452 family)